MAQTFPHGYALLVGVGTTAYTPLSLPVTVKDVRAVRKVLTDPTLCGYPDNDEHIRLLHDQGATRTAILEGLTWMKERVATHPEATAIVFFSGHGALERSSGHYFLITHDAKPHDISGSTISGEEFSNRLREVKAQRLLVVIDSCHAQGMASSKEDATQLDLPPEFEQTAATEGKGLLAAMQQGEGRVVLASSRGHQKSYIRQDSSLSVFTYHLLEALQGAGNKPGDAEVRWSDLTGHLGRAVPESTFQMYSAEQVPFFDTSAENFPVALLNGGKGLPPGGWNAAKPAADEVILNITKVVASGERAVAIGGSVSGGSIITGDQDRISRSTLKRKV